MLVEAKRKEFLNPGEFVFAGSGTHLHTLLGSCIAITLWHPEYHIGGMCHFVLPSRPAGEVNTNGEPNGRYGDEAMMLFKLAAKLHRTPLTEYVAKVIGGADIIGYGANKEDARIGTQNTNKAITMLSALKIPIAMAHVGECGSRRVVLDLDSGDVWVKHRAGKDGPTLMDSVN